MTVLKQFAQIALCLALIPPLALLNLVAAVRAGVRPKVGAFNAGTLQVVLPYPPGERSGASKAMQGLLAVLEGSFQIRRVGLYELESGAGRLARRMGDLISWPLPMAAYCRPFVAAPGAVTRQLRDDAPVLVEFVSGAMFLLLGRRPRTTVVLRDHEVLCRRLGMESQAARGLRRLLGWTRLLAAYLLTSKIYLEADRIVALTPEDGAYLEQWFPWLRRKVVVIPATIELPAAPVRPIASSIEPAVLFLANFYHRPNVEGLQWFLRDVAPNLRRPVTLHLVGLDDPIRDMTLESANVRVVRHGFLEDVNETLPDVRVAVAPLISGGGIRIKNLFLGSLGKAVVTTSLGNQGIGFEPGVEAAICGNGKEMADAIDALIADPEAAQSMGERARAFVARHFSPEATLARYQTEVFGVEARAPVRAP